MTNQTAWDMGLCGFSTCYYPHIVADKRFTDYKWQITQCYEHWQGGTRFYGADNIDRMIKHFIIY